MRTSTRLARNYPKLNSWLYRRMASIPDNVRVWDAFKRYAELSEADARTALTLCTEKPVIDYDNITDYGVFRGGTNPDTVYIAQFICDRFENHDSADPRMHALVEATVLHELVHWGDWKDGVDQAGEEGWTFEGVAYDSSPARYW